jgi:hypothetical protein
MRLLSTVLWLFLLYSPIAVPAALRADEPRRPIGTAPAEAEPVAAKPPALSQDEIDTKAGEWETFTVTFDPKKKLVWDTTYRPQDCQLIRVYNDAAGEASFMIRARKKGTFYTLFRHRGEDKSSLLTTTTESTPPPAPPVPVPPGPTPNPPTPPPAPVVDAKVWGIVWVEETEEAKTSRGRLVSSPEFFDFFKTSGWKRKIVDQNVVDEAGQTPAALKPYIARAKEKGMPWLMVVGEKDGKGVVIAEQRPPDDPKEVVALLKKYAK